MKLTNLPKEFIQAIPVIKKIEEAGFEAYFVGGSVRDVLLNQPIHDVDIATSAFPAEIKELFPRTIDVGIEHGTVLVLAEDSQYEITTFRTESTYQDFRRPDKVQFVRSLEEDLKRRDFTINALALRENGEIVDLFDGLTDLENKILRAVGDPHERFHEDALRMMRGLRFVSQLGFELEPMTRAAIKENHALLSKISIERIHIEFIKLLQGAYRGPSIRAFYETACYKYCPGLEERGAGLLQFAELPNVPIITESQAWTVLLDCLGLSEKEVASFLKKWKCSNQTIHETQELLWGLSKRKQAWWDKLTIYKLGLKQSLAVEELAPYYSFQKRMAEVEDLNAQLPIHSLSELAVNGNELMKQLNKAPGKWLSIMLQACEKAVVEGQLTNEKAVLLTYAEEQLAQIEG
ncbi:CCA tRNA nucleotidyltransferase [Enterococcus sp. JM4C]|uniref:CCA tRNA nucleotidyltransferase n=1 Tax=Candidatus Enterococcus huntleyi TaxID=1857217 RepID=UPI001379FE5F|nr:CCA tRNA nucleotidyltransferase [Enterococcus sp. JM4C]KAF1298080.1 CCA tRNA nucleotidyltransferase [Enterococcus sp. JM4C]